MRRPELGAAAGFVLVTIFFLSTADASMFTLAGIMNVLAPASQLGILAIAAALLMIGGEFDLSIGSMVAFAGLLFGALVMLSDLPLIAAIALTIVFAALLGGINGQIVIRTKLPSFIVTLAFLFILRGLSLVGLKWVTGGSTQLRGIGERAGEGLLRDLFSGVALEGLFAWLAAYDIIAKFPNGAPTVTGVPVSILWFVGFAALGTWILLRTRLGNWIFASGGDPVAARNVGVPVARTKVTLFILTAVAATIFASIQVLTAGSADTLRGTQKEFEAIIAAVIGGTLLTGGYGSAIGAMFGAFIFGFVQMGIFYTGVDTDWFKLFMGAMLIIAVLFNSYVLKRATGAR
jgi:simple sugar transport system permease protein